MLINTHDHSTTPDLSDTKMQRCRNYIHALEDERRKIQVFQRELPLCLQLVSQAIETCKQQFSSTTTEYNSNGGQSECSEQTSSDAPVLEEFIPIKRAPSHSDDEEQESSKKSRNDDQDNNCNDDRNPKKSDWLRSAQLWNQSSDPSAKEGSPRKVAVTEVKRNGSGGAFHPFKKNDKSVAANASAAPPPSNSSTAEAGAGSKKEEKEGQSQRKTRRCWSPELHRRFLQALQQLGGSHVATPKQIRELMKVDGLTNDEVKSHLQKYRLHTRRPAHSIQNNSSSNNAQPPQFVVVGGIWVPPEYAAMATTAVSAEASGVATSTGVYAPIAALPPPFREASSPLSKQRQHKSGDDRGSQSEGKEGVRSHSPATSSSTHTTTASLAC